MQVSLEPFRAAERRDPTGTGVHLLCALAWALCLALGRVPEGITWGALAVITVVRLPRTYQLYCPLFRQLPVLLLAALWLWGVCTLLWSDYRPEAASAWVDLLLPRALILGLLLWPVIHRWPAILCALAAGSAAAAAARVAGVQLISHLSTSGLLANVGMAAALALLVHAPTLWGWAGGLALAGLTGAQMLLLTVRTAIVACVAAAGVLLARPTTKRGALPRWATALILVLATAGAVALRGGAVVDAFKQPFRLMDSERQMNNRAARAPAAPTAPTRAADDGPAIPTANVRIVLWRLAWEKFREHPVLGNGILAWQPTLQRAFAEEPQHYGADLVGADRLIRKPPPHPHNVVMDQLFAKGLVGAGLFAALMVTLWVRTWRAGGAGWARSTMLALLTAWCASSMTAGVDRIVVGGSLLMLMALVSAVRDD